ncbi:hypothetical protein JKP88DRAFT_217265 [Tribonema minus]|uniref:Uncharacterized protein n=1 Tax=Tribonema minus TaxID=303371 RepID=A0A835ZI10_9STRA|nr:hypothetical protein JKP88DRAFT_217265 [Tribonema minus]
MMGDNDREGNRAVPGTDASYDDGDEDQPRTSAQNVIPTEQLQNGLRTAKSLWLVGWNGVKDTWKTVESSEQVARLKEAAAPVVERAATGLSEVGQTVGAATQKGMQWTGERFEEAKPHLVEFKDRAVVVTKDLQRKVTGAPPDDGSGSTAPRSPPRRDDAGGSGGAESGTI